MNLFSFDLEAFKFKTNKVKLFEAFSGIGTQAMALKKIGLNVDHVGISEIDKYALKSYRAIHGNVKNYGDITEIKGSTLPSIDIFTYSFPCQDLSNAGNGAGVLGNTRSGLVFEVTRILNEMNDLPNVLLMENVPDLLNIKHKDGWHIIYNEIEKLGYKNYVKILNAKDFGIPQNRKRVFMISILDNYSYTFPNNMNLDRTLKDFLEENVEDKYYLTHDQLKQISNWNSYSKPLDNARTFKCETLQTITAKSNTTMNSSMLLIKEATSRGYKEAYLGDGIYINRPHQKRGVVQTKTIPTIKTSIDDLGVIVPNKTLPLNSKVKGKQPSLQNRIYDSKGLSTSLTTSYHPNYNTKLGVRKLTPIEAWRLMGISDDDFYKAKNSGISDSQLYKQAGNAIVVDVLCNIFKQLV